MGGLRTRSDSTARAVSTLAAAGGHVTGAAIRVSRVCVGARTTNTEVGCGSCGGRGATPPQDSALVRRVRDLPRESGLPAGIARLVGGRPWWLGGGPDLGNHGAHHRPCCRPLL